MFTKRIFFTILVLLIWGAFRPASAITDAERLENGLKLQGNRFGGPTGTFSIGINTYEEVSPGMRVQFAFYSSACSCPDWTTRVTWKYSGALEPLKEEILGRYPNASFAGGSFTISQSRLVGVLPSQMGVMPFRVKAAEDIPAGVTEIFVKAVVDISGPLSGSNEIDTRADLILPVSLKKEAITKRPGMVGRGEEFRYRITLSTRDLVDQITVEDVLPGAELGELVKGSVAPPPDSSSGGRLTWQVANLQGERTFEYLFRVKDEPPEEATEVRNQVSAKRSDGTTVYATSTLEIHEGVVLEYQAKTKRPGVVSEGEIVDYTLTATPADMADSLTVTNVLPPRTAIVEGSIDEDGELRGDQITWKFANTDSAEMHFSLEVKKQKKSILFITNRGSAEATIGGESETGKKSHALRFLQEFARLEVADGMSRELSGIFLPDPANGDRLPGLDWRLTRAVDGVAADGVALLVLKATIKAKKHGKLVVSVMEEEYGAEAGSLWPTDATGLIDDSAEGGAREGMPEGSTEITLTPVKDPWIKKQEVAFCLYRSPRNFDAAGTDGIQSRPVRLRVEVFDKDDAEVLESDNVELSIVRPLVILQHGTFDSPSGWAQFPLFVQGGNQEAGYQGFNATYPFQVGRSDFSTYRKAAGDLIGSAYWTGRTLNRELERWREQTGCAGSQADVVCHSYGGVNMRYVAQTQADPNPVTPTTLRNFRNATNWGHGSFHKLITIATTHRGSPMGNHIAFLNHFGKAPGMVAFAAMQQGNDVAAGATEDQMILSPTLRMLKRTRVPGHAIAGSGWPEFNTSYEQRLFMLWAADTEDGPYRTIGQLYNDFPPYMNEPNWAIFRAVANYGFNRNAYVLVDDTTQDPNYDLTVSAYSSKGRMPRMAQSTPDDLEAQLGIPEVGSLRGRLTHGDEIWPGAGDPAPVAAVALRVAWLLRQRTDSGYFAEFPGTMEGGTTPTEDAWSDHDFYDPAWLTEQPGPVTEYPISEPTISLDPPDTVVSPGDEIEVSVTWEAEEFGEAYLAWPSGRPGDTGFLPITSADNTRTFVVPDRRPGTIQIGAMIVTTEGARTASVDLELVEADPIVELNAGPASFMLRSLEPTTLSVQGRDEAGNWYDLTASPRLVLTSSDPSVVAISEDDGADRFAEGGRLEPRGFGTATVLVKYDGGPEAEVTVTVSGETVPFGISPKKKRVVLKRKKKRPIDFVFLSGPGFDPGEIDEATVRVGGRVPVKFKTKDYNKDGVKDLAAFVSARDLDLTPGFDAVSAVAQRKDGSLVTGRGEARVK